MTQEMTTTEQAPQALAVKEEPIFDAELAAFSPLELTSQQGKIAAFVAAKIDELKAQIVELESELKIAVDSGWRTGGWDLQIRLAEKRVEYYTKMRTALEAGYMIIPAMDADVIAVRTTRRKPAAKVVKNMWNVPSVESNAPPIGTGNYVSPLPLVHTENVNELGRDQKPVLKKYLHACDFSAVDFPMDVAKPVVMSATARAMQLKVFDEIGVVRDKRQSKRNDPFLVGRIIDPRKGRSGVGFFIGWFLDLRSL